MDISTIGIEFRTEGLARGTAALKENERQAGRTADAADRTGAAAKRASDGFSSFGNVLRALGLGLVLREFIQLSDQYAKYTAQLKLATSSTQEYANANREVERIAKATQGGLSATAVLYARITNASKELGVNQSQVAKITETVGLSLRVSGATAAESSSAMLQLSQAFGAGALRGEEFNAVNEAAPGLLSILAESMGVTRGALKKLAEDGKLTTDVLTRAFTNDRVLEGLRAQGEQVRTISGAFQLLKDQLVLFVGEANKASGASGALAAVIAFVAENLSALTTAALSFVGVKIALAFQSAAKFALEKVASFTAATAATAALRTATLATAQADVSATASAVALTAARVAELRAAVLAAEGNVALAIATNGLIPAQARAAAAATAHAASLTALTVAKTGATGAAGLAARAVGFLGGPIGIVTTLLGIGATAWAAWGKSTETAVQQAEKSVLDNAADFRAELQAQIDLIEKRNRAAAGGAPTQENKALENLGALEKEIARLKNEKTETYAQEQARIVQLQATLRAYGGVVTDVSRKEAAANSERERLNGTAIQNVYKKYATDAEKLTEALKEATKAAGGVLPKDLEARIRASFNKGAIKDFNKEIQSQAKLLAELSGLNGDYFDDLTRLEKIRKSGNLTEAQYVALVEQLIAKQPSSIKLAKELADAEKLRVDAINESYAAELKRAEALEGTVDGLAEQNAALKNEIELIGLTERAQLAILQARNETIILTKEATLAELERASATTGTQTRIEIALKEEIRLLRDRNKGLGKKLDRTEAAKVYDGLQAEGKRFYEDLERGLTDSLFRAFEAGKGFFSTLWDGIKNLFRTTVLRLLINPVAGALTGGLGLAGSAAAGQGGGLSGLSGLSSLAGIGGSFGSGLSAGFSALLGESGISGAISAGLTSIGTATGSGIAAGLGTLAGAFGPIAIGVGALYNYFKSKEGGPKTESGFGPLVPNVGDPTAARAISQSITAGYTELARELGIRVGDLQVGVLTAIDSRGTALTQLAVEAVLDGQTISSRGARLGTNENVGRTPEALTAAVAEEYNVVLLEALKRSNLRDDLRAYLDSYVASGLNPETAIDNLQLLAGTDRAFAALGLRFSYLTGLSLETQQAIVGLAGGLDAFVTNLAAYEQNFYTEAERSASTLAAVGLQLSALNLMLPTTREGFRALVEAQDLTTEAGQRAYTTLLAASGAFASAVPAIEATANAAAELASTLRQSLSDALDAARSNTDAAYAALERATDAQRALAQEQIDAISGVISAIGDNVRSLYNEVDSTRAQSARDGTAFIAQALETARLTGYLPDGEKLSEAISAARSDQVFATQQEADFQRLVLAGQLSQLGDLAGDQLSESERMLKSLDDGLALARAQIDAVRGVDNSVINVVDAIAALNTSLAAEIQALKAVTEIGNATLASQFGSFTSSIYQLELGRAPDPTGLAYFSDRLSAGASLSDVAAGIANSPEALARDAIARAMQAVSSTAQTPTPPPPPAFSNPFDSAVAEIYRSQLGRDPDAAGLEYFSSRLSGGAALADVLAEISGSQEAQMRNLLAGLPQYEQGTPFVPNDGLAFLHRGEAVIPSQYNSGGQGSGDMVAEIRAMRAELAELRKSAAATAANTDRTAEAVNGRPDRPMLVEMAA